MRLTPVGTKRDKFHGSGGGSAGRAATSDTRDHNSSPINHSKHGHLLTNCNLIGTNMKANEAGNFEHRWGNIFPVQHLL